MATKNCLGSFIKETENIQAQNERLTKQYSYFRKITGSNRPADQKINSRPDKAPVYIIHVKYKIGAPTFTPKVETLPETVVVEFIITGHSDQSTPCWAQRIEHLNPCLQPYLDRTEAHDSHHYQKIVLTRGPQA